MRLRSVANALIMSRKIAMQKCFTCVLRFATFSNRASSHYELGAKSQSLQYQTFKSKLTSAFATAEINKKLGILIFVVSTDFNFLIVSYKA
jgi:hypothetical protein